MELILKLEKDLKTPGVYWRFLEKTPVWQIADPME